MTLDEAKIIAHEIMSGKTRSYVRAANELAEFILGLEPGKNIVEIEETGNLPAEPFPPSPSIIPVIYDDERESIVDTTTEYPIRYDDEDEL